MRIPRSLLAACCFLPLLALTDIAAAADGGQLDVNFFYDQLKDQGSWFNTTEYGDVWQPYTAYKNEAWRPYTDGYWTYTDGGWMFNSNESFGWAVYHYGRWTRLKDIGWAWVPGTDWAPAWVTWRSNDPNGPATPPDSANVAATSTDQPAAATPAPAPASGGGAVNEDYIGWAPLPPDASYNEDASYGPAVDADLGIDPDDYCFTSVGLFGAPWIAGVLFDSGRGYYCCEHSANITHLYFNRQGGYRGWYAGGPNYDRLRGRTQRPIPQLAIRRDAALARGDRLNRVEGRNVSVFAPRFARAGVGPGGRVQFNRQGTLAKAAVVPGAQRGGGAAADAQGRARESFSRQALDERQRNPGGSGKRSAVATPNGVQPAPAVANPGEARPPTTAAKADNPGNPANGGNKAQVRHGTAVKKSRTQGGAKSGGSHHQSHSGGGHGGGSNHGGGHGGGGDHGGHGGGGDKKH